LGEEVFKKICKQSLFFLYFQIHFVFSIALAVFIVTPLPQSMLLLPWWSILWLLLVFN